MDMERRLMDQEREASRLHDLYKKYYGLYLLRLSDANHLRMELENSEEQCTRKDREIAELRSNLEQLKNHCLKFHRETRLGDNGGYYAGPPHMYQPDLVRRPQAQLSAPPAPPGPGPPPPSGYHVGESSSRPSPRMCKFWIKGLHCRQGMNCSFGHGAQELTSSFIFRNRVLPCPRFHSPGGCLGGNTCPYNHSA